MKNILEIEHLSLSLPSRKGMVPILHDVNLHVGEGKILGLVGESGSGKSMTAFAVTRLLPGEEKAELDGSIHLCVRQLLGISRKSMEEVRGRDVSMIFQEPMTCLNPVFTIGTQMMDVIRTHEKMSSGDARKKALAMLEAVHIRNGDDVISCYPYQLSGGMRQRAALVRTLVLKPDLLLLDEPFSALDYQTRLTVSDDIYRILRSQQMSAILVTHDISEAISFCDRIIVLTKRPASVKKTFDIHLTLDKERTPFEARMAPEFKDYFNEIWGELNV